MSHEYTFYPELCSFPNMNVEIELIAEFDYQPAEAQTFDYPGCEEEVQITDIYPDPLIKDNRKLLLAYSVAYYYNRDSMDLDHLAIKILENKEDWK